MGEGDVIAVPLTDLYLGSHPGSLFARADGSEAEVALIGGKPVDMHHVAAGEVEMLGEFPAEIIEVFDLHHLLAVDLHLLGIRRLAPAADAESSGLRIGAAEEGDDVSGGVSRLRHCGGHGEFLHGGLRPGLVEIGVSHIAEIYCRCGLCVGRMHTEHVGGTILSIILPSFGHFGSELAHLEGGYIPFVDVIFGDADDIVLLHAAIDSEAHIDRLAYGVGIPVKLEVSLGELADIVVAGHCAQTARAVGRGVADGEFQGLGSIRGRLSIIYGALIPVDVLESGSEISVAIDDDKILRGERKRRA